MARSARSNRSGVGAASPGAGAYLHLGAIHPATAGAGARAPLHAALRQQPPAGRAPGRSPERGRRRDAGARPPRLAGARRSAGDGGPAQGGHAARAGGDLVARARHRHGRDRPGGSDRGAALGRRPGCSASAAPATRRAPPAWGSSSRSIAATWWPAPLSTRAMHDGRRWSPSATRAMPLDVLAQQIVAMVAVEDWRRRRAVRAGAARRALHAT